MIVIDGRTDEEKLLELLASGAEQTALDFKATLDLSKKTSADTLHLVKDCVSMSNLPTGGYIVVGVDDAGRPAHDHAGVDVSKFDSAALRSRISKYTEAPINVISAHHTVDGRAVVVIYAVPNADGLPVPFSAIGQFERAGGGMETVFRPGEIVVREGTSNVQLRYSHWTALLQPYRERVREEAMRDANSLIGRFVTALGDVREPSGHPGVVLPLVVGMDWDTFEEALTSHLEVQNVVRMRRFLRTAVDTVTQNRPQTPAADGADDRRAAEYEASLDAVAVVAIHAAEHDRADIFDLAVDALNDAYTAGGRAPTLDGSHNAVSASHWLAIIERVFAIGRMVVAQRRFQLLPGLVNRKIPVSSAGYSYASWIRHAQVNAAQYDLIKEGGNLLSAVRQLLGERPWLRPDVTMPTEHEPGSALDPNDMLLNALAQFDMWWCVMAQTHTVKSFGYDFYPSCAALHQYRCQPALDTIAGDRTARAAAFPNAQDADVARALKIVLELAERESWKYGGFWDRNTSAPVAEFLARHTDV